jgi:ATP-dependent helicase/nuclease subunit A
MADVKLSNIQQQIVGTTDPKKGLCVTASAGSGKTTVMLQRLMAILERDETVEMDQLLAITFTDKAANNIKVKVRRLLQEKVRAHAPGRARDRYARCLRRLEESYIGTIHAFAARVLREHPVEAGVEPGFSIIADGMDGVMMDRVIDRLFSELALKGAAAVRHDAEKQFALLKEHRTDAVRSALKNIYSKSRNYEVTPDKISIQDRAGDCARACEAVQKAVHQLGGMRATPSFDAAMEKAGTILARVKNAADLDVGTIGALSSAIKSVRFSKNTPADIREPFARLKEELLPDLPLYYYERLSQENKTVFLNLFRSFAGLYEAEKRADMVLDYDDLLWYTWLLFRSDDPVRQSVTARYRARFKYIMVDEFQDTSRLQSGIVTALARGNNLFIVGDRKQSIYGFRNADPNLIRSVGGEIADAGGECIALEENYRSRPGLVAFANFVFGEMLPDDYRDVSAGSRVPADHRWEHDVEILRVSKHGEEQEGEDGGAAAGDTGTTETIGRELEAHRLAGRLKDLIEHKKVHVRDVEDGRLCHRPAGYKDVAILFRSMGDSHFYEDALEQHGIPYYVIKGSHFFGRPEVRDCVNFLKVIDDPSLDIETASVLKSPFVGVTDDALILVRGHQLALQKKLHARPGLFETVKAYCAAPGVSGAFGEDDRAKLNNFMRVCDRALAHKDNYAISDLLQFLVTGCAFDVASIGKRNGERRYANVKKLVEKAREFEKGKFFTLREFVRYIEQMEVEEVDEAEAQVELEEGGETVRLCTIHKAKGLEFPIVVLADLGREFPNNGQEFYSFSKEGVLGLKGKDPLTGKLEKTKTVHECNERKKEEEIDERKRLFYVAVTRARDYLILSGVSGGRDEDKIGSAFSEKGYAGFTSYIEWVDYICMRITLARAQERKLGFECLFTPALPDAFDPDESHCFREAPRLGYADPEKAFEKYFSVKPDPKAEKDVADLLVRLDAIRGKKAPVEIDFAVTPLLEFQECPRRYFRLVELREEYPQKADERDEVSEDADEIETRLPRNRFGDLFHLVMQRFNFQNPDPLKEAKRLISDLGSSALSEDRDELASLTAGFSRHDVFKKIRLSFASQKAYREVPFIARDAAGVVRGTIDLLFYEEGAGWTILDYKTNGDYPGMVEEKTAYYDFQLLVYAHAVRKITGELPKKLALYFAVPQVLVEIAVDETLLRKTEEELAVSRKTIAAGDFQNGCGREECPFCAQIPPSAGTIPAGRKRKTH